MFGKRTSNPGGSDLQFLQVSPNNEPLYLHVAKLAAQKWNASGQISLVVGATFPEEIAKVRAIVGEMPLLIPGIGAQGGDIHATVKAGSVLNHPGMGMMVNSSRAILYASAGNDFAQAAINFWDGKMTIQDAKAKLRSMEKIIQKDNELLSKKIP